MQTRALFIKFCVAWSIMIFNLKTNLYEGLITVCPRSSDPFYKVTYYKKNGSLLLGHTLLKDTDPLRKESPVFMAQLDVRYEIFIIHSKVFDLTVLFSLSIALSLYNLNIAVKMGSLFYGLCEAVYMNQIVRPSVPCLV